MQKAKSGLLKVLVCFLLSICLIVPLVACGESDDPKITVSPTTVTVEEGKTANVTATLKNITGDVTWTVDDDTIATVEASAATTKAATITGVAEGTAVVTATAGGKSATVNVTVTEAQQAPGGDEEDDDNGVTITLNGEAVGTAPYNMHVNGTLEFAATADNGGTIVWESSDSTIASVVDGLVTGVAAGNAVITAKVSDTVKATVSVNVAAPTNVANGGENTYETGWRYWFGDGAVSVSSCVNYANDNETQITYTMTGGQFYSVQLFYKDKYAYTDHDVSLTVVSPIETNITINGAKQELVEGENEVTVENYTGATLLVAFGVEGENIASGTNLTFVFKNLVVTSNAEVELVAPTFAFDEDTKVITVTDTENESSNVEKYTLGLFNAATDVDPAYTIDVTDGEAVNFAAIPSGTYILKLRAANSSNTVVTSPWSATTATFEWSNDKTPLEYSEKQNIAAESATWYYWNQTWDPVCSFTECYTDGDNVYVVGLTGNTGDNWSFQLFYKATFTSCTMNVTSSTSGTITINGTEYELTANTPCPVTLTANTEISIQFGANVSGGTAKNLSGNITLSDITFA